MKIQNHWQLDVYKLSVEASMEIFEMSKSFPAEKTYSLTDQIRRSSRSVLSQIGEEQRRRKYEGAFINNLNEAEGEAGETQVWIEYSVKCKYIARKKGVALHKKYDSIIGKLVMMGNNPSLWILNHKNKRTARPLTFPPSQFLNL